MKVATDKHLQATGTLSLCDKLEGKFRKSIITWLTKTTSLGTLFSVNQWQNQVCIKDIIPISSALPTNFKFIYYSFERSDMISARAILNLL